MKGQDAGGEEKSRRRPCAKFWHSVSFGATCAEFGAGLSVMSFVMKHGVRRLTWKIPVKVLIEQLRHLEI